MSRKYCFPRSHFPKPVRSSSDHSTLCVACAALEIAIKSNSLMIARHVMGAPFFHRLTNLRCLRRRRQNTEDIFVIDPRNLLFSLLSGSKKKLERQPGTLNIELRSSWPSGKSSPKLNFSSPSIRSRLLTPYFSPFLRFRKTNN